MKDPKVIVALDFAKKEDALSFVDQVTPSDCRLKIGKEMFTYYGPQFVEQLVKKGFDVFLDLKFHDIPTTVAKAVKASVEMGVWMVNVHASGGRKMMEAAREVLIPYGDKAPLLIAVTVLTSMEQCDLADIGLDISPFEQVLRLATLTKEAGLDGVVCSAQEASALKSTLGHEFKLITPGIRLVANTKTDDQSRVMTPIDAINAGADYLVIGRPVTQAADPLAVLRQINSTLA
ncbi:orotidine-5'-phosphate decarboxylase [uncultured Tolumonas sp.]|uniref:orotidine-5'-phosphate decarboxylase n=1 Tax=uncultured Tolumonas sp. TaxID=263765 RepID=UPI0029315636|nr:orotidine-5'-phosphate decarboxylase [uncultured Tolumonas sp.]